MKIILALLLLLSISSTAEAACKANASRKWGDFRVEASASGPDCGKAVLTLVVRADDGFAVWNGTFVAEQLMNFSESPIAGSKAMTARMTEWISGNGFMPSADKLKLDGEFPFTPSDQLAEGMFADARKDKAPLFCFVQGSESGKCLAVLSDGEVVELGIQAFP